MRCMSLSSLHCPVRLLRCLRSLQCFHASCPEWPRGDNRDSDDEFEACDRTLFWRTLGGDSSKVGLVLATSHGTTNHDIAILTPKALSARELQSLSLIVLASCSTGKNPRSNQDPGSIAQAFASIGVPNVVAAQWDVDSETTSTFMKSFYQSLLTGSSVAGSLRSATKVLLAGPDSSHPYYWAAFTVFGRG